jgi:hypothetical protein
MPTNYTVDGITSLLPEHENVYYTFEDLSLPEDFENLYIPFCLIEAYWVAHLGLLIDRKLCSNILNNAYNYFTEEYKQFIKIRKDYGNIFDCHDYFNKNGGKINLNPYFGEPGQFFALTCLDTYRYFQQIKSECFNKLGYVYIIENNNFYKIGMTRDPEKRIKSYFKTENPNEYNTITYKNVFMYSELEKILHLKFLDKNHNREWFNLNSTDLFEADNIIKDFLYENNQ